MKLLRFALPLILLALSTAAPAQSDAQKSFDKLKALSGSWEGTITTTPPQDEVQGKSVQLSLRTTSMGNALMHEMKVAGRPDDPITMLYLDGDRLMLTHYCDAGNRPRMVAKSSPDGKTVEFDFLDIAGSTQYGHMHHALFTMIDANHHTEDWTFMVGENAVDAHFDLQRAK
ncbi:MAG: hypothetical protein ACRD3B_00535 [Candidatus Sulfotelmatobacter sp.]